MELGIDLAVDKRELLLQEDAILRVTLTNRGNAPLSVTHPAYSELLPLFRVLDLRTGAERIRRKSKRSPVPERERKLGAGQGVVSSASLLKETALPAAGEYEISALFRAGQEQVESSPIRVQVLPTIPKSLSLDTVQGVVSYGAWINLASNPPQVVWSRFDLRPGGGVRTAVPIAPATAQANPVLSVPPNGTDRRGNWIAWLEGGALRFAHFSEDLGSTPVQQLQLPGEAQVIPPLHGDPLTEVRVRPTASALLWQGGLRCIRLTAEKALPGPILDHPRPAWGHSWTRSEGSRSAVLLHFADGRTSCSAVSWSDQTIGKPRSLTTWNGSVLCGHATLDFEDVLHGATLLWAGKSGALHPEMVLWEIDSKGAFQEKGRQDLGWSPSRPLANAMVRVSAGGDGAILLQDDDGSWFTGNGRKLERVPISRPLEMAFLGDSDPVVIAAQEGGGLQVSKMDGSPLPPSRA